MHRFVLSHWAFWVLSLSNHFCRVECDCDQLGLVLDKGESGPQLTGLVLDKGESGPWLTGLVLDKGESGPWLTGLVLDKGESGRCEWTVRVDGVSGRCEWNALCCQSRLAVVFQGLNGNVCSQLCAVSDRRLAQF